MHYILIVFLCFISILSCKEESKKEIEKPKLVMAETSEMAVLMREMFAFNQSIRQQIIDGELANDYPVSFDRIHSALLTKPEVRNANFESFSKLFLEAEKSVFEDSNQDLVVRYNNAVNACISCHNVTCTGPIPKIKKLLID